MNKQRTITNEANLPIPMYNALSANTYIGGGNISVTRVIAPPRIVTLRTFHEHEIVEDASDRIWMLLGNGVHYMLQHSAGDSKDIIVETRLFMKFPGLQQSGPYGEWTLSGQPDVYQLTNKALYDYKVTSIWAALSSKPEWDKQINLQAMLHRHKGDEVREGYIIAVLRDWQNSKAKYEKDYPAVAVKPIAIPLWTQGEAIEYAGKRIKMHQRVQLEYERSNFDPSVLPECTDDEKWYRGQKFAVKKMDDKGKINKKSDRVFTTKADALEYMEQNASTLPKGKRYAPVEERPGEYIRCARYCDVAFKCPFGQKVRAALVNEKMPETSEELETELFGG